MGRRPTPTAATSDAGGRAPPRRRRARRVVLALGATLLALLAAAAAALWRLSDVEKTLDAAAARLASTTDLVLTHGPVGVSLGHRLGVAIRDVKLVDRRRERTLFDASSLVIALDLAPLVHGSVELHEVVAHQPRLFGERAADGSIDLVDAVDRVVAAAKTDHADEPARRRPFVTQLGVDRIEIHGARLDWQDALHPAGPQRAVLEPVDVTLTRDRTTRSVVAEARATLAEPRSRGAGGDAPATALSVHGSLSGFGSAARLAEATWDVEVGATDADLALIEPWLAPALGAGAALAGRARVEAHAQGSWDAGLETRAQVVIDAARVALPAAWEVPQRFRRVELGARVTRHAGRWSIEDGKLEADDVALSLHGAIDEPGSADPALDLEVTSPWLDLASARHRVPTRALGHVFAYFARVIEEGQGRIDRLAVRGRLSELASLADPAHRDALSGRFSFAKVAGTPHAGLDRMSAIAGTLVLEHGDLALVGFTGRSGDSDLGRVSGAVRALWSGPRTEIRAEGTDAALADVTRLLASDVFPAGARAAASELDVSSGRAAGRITLQLEPRRPIRFAGEATLRAGALAVRSPQASVTELAGPLAFSERRLASAGLAFRLGGSSPVRVAGAVTDYASRPSLALAVEGRGVPAAELERLLAPDTSPAEAPRRAGRVSGSVRLEGRLDEPASLVRAASLALDRVDVGPPLVAQRLDDVTGQVSFDRDGVDFDVSSLVWRGHRAAASGRVRGLGERAPRVEVDGRALEPLDIGRVAGLSETPAAATPMRPGSERDGDGGSALVVVGRYHASEARFRDAAIRDLAVAFRFHDGTLDLEHVSGTAMDGRFEGRAGVRLGGAGPIEIELAPRLSGVDAAGLARLLDLPWQKLTGHAELSGELGFAWPPSEHPESVHGHLDLRLVDGRVFEAVALWKVLDLVDFSRWLTSPMGWREMGLAYDELRGRLELGSSRLVTRDLSLSGPTVDLAIDATLGLADRSVDALVRVSPLQLVDQVVDPIPVVGPVKRALDLTSYSFRLQGTLGSIHVMPATLDRVDSLIDEVVPDVGVGRERERRSP